MGRTLSWGPPRFCRACDRVSRGCILAPSTPHSLFNYSTILYTSSCLSAMPAIYPALPPTRPKFRSIPLLEVRLFPPPSSESVAARAPLPRILLSRYTCCCYPIRRPPFSPVAQASTASVKSRGNALLPAPLANCRRICRVKLVYIGRRGLRAVCRIARGMYQSGRSWTSSIGGHGGGIEVRASLLLAQDSPAHVASLQASSCSTCVSSFHS